VVVVPGDAVDGHVVRLVSVEERRRVSLRTDVQLALLGADQVQVVLVHVEVERRTAAYTMITITIIITTTTFMVLSSCPKSSREFTQFI